MLDHSDEGRFHTVSLLTIELDLRPAASPSPLISQLVLEA
jgi:hypothetical protein